MSSLLALRFTKLLRLSASSTSQVVSLQRNSKMWYCSGLDENDNDDKNEEIEGEFENFLGQKSELLPQGVNPRKGWSHRGVHKAIICGKLKDAPVQKILRNGGTVTIFSVGTGGLFDQRIGPNRDLPRPPQWHRIAVHNDSLGAYAVQKLAKNSSVYVEGDIETRVYNDSISGEVRNIAEICVRRDGSVRLINTGESISNISIDDLREGLV